MVPNKREEHQTNLDYQILKTLSTSDKRNVFLVNLIQPNEIGSKSQIGDFLQKFRVNENGPNLPSGKFLYESPDSYFGTNRIRSVLKEVKLTNKEEQQDHQLIENEVSILQKLQSECHNCTWFPKLLHYHVEKSEEIATYRIFLEYCEGMDLYDYIQRRLRVLPRNDQYREIKRIFLEITKILVSLHDFHITHCDLKPENIYMVIDPVSSVYYPMLIDFNLSLDWQMRSTGTISNHTISNHTISNHTISDHTISDHTILSEEQRQLNQKIVHVRKGTKHYVSPELVLGQLGNYTDSCLNDLWSLGVTLYVTLYRMFPFSVRDSFMSLINYSDPNASWKLRLKKEPTPFNGLFEQIFVPINQRLSLKEFSQELEMLELSK